MMVKRLPLVRMRCKKCDLYLADVPQESWIWCPRCGKIYQAKREVKKIGRVQK